MLTLKRDIFNRVVLPSLFLGLLITGCKMEALNNKPNFIPIAYTAMDDILIPDPPFAYQGRSEEYRFEPIIFRIGYKDEDDFEENTYIYITPIISKNVAHLDDVATAWQASVNKESNSLIQIQKKGTIQLAATQSYELIYTAIGYDDKRDKHSRFIERVYFIPVTDKQVTAIRFVRDVNDDNQTTPFWSDWQHFIKSLRVGTPSIQAATTIGKEHNTRHYHTRHLSFDIPIGDETKLNKWSIKLNANRRDSWKTDSGEIRVSYAIADGYDETQESQNKAYKEKAESWGNHGSEILKALSSTQSYEYEYQEISFGKDDTIYGLLTYKDSTTTMDFNVSYKYGKSITIELKGDKETMEKNKAFILEWLTQFYVMK